MVSFAAATLRAAQMSAEACRPLTILATSNLARWSEISRCMLRAGCAHDGMRRAQTPLSCKSLSHGYFATWYRACSPALNCRSNDCHVGLLFMMQHALESRHTCMSTICEVLRISLQYSPHRFQAKPLNWSERCSRVPLGAEPLRVVAVRTVYCKVVLVKVKRKVYAPP